MKFFFNKKLKLTMNTKSSNMWTLVSQTDQLDLPRTTVITPPFRIGRREGFDLCIPCRNVSGLHAEILEKEDGLWIYDLNSTNGTFVNGERISKKTKVEHGDQLRFGSSIFEVECSAEGSGRLPASTIENVEEFVESVQDRFDRLIESGATPNFQPIVEISSGGIEEIGFEVLGRSRLFGLNTPAEMFATAEEFDMQSELSRVLRFRGFQVADNNLAKDQMLFVNTHPSELETDDLIKNLEEIRESFPDRPVVVELPEQVLDSPQSTTNLVSAIRDLNIKLAIHDFGSEKIRLSTLNELAPDIVKFDGALVQGIDNATEKHQRLVSAIVKMVSEMGIIPMAEFVEYESEHEILRQLGVQYAQGYYYGRPIAIESVESSESDSADESEPKTIGGNPSQVELGAALKQNEGRPAKKLKKLEELQQLEEKGECDDECYSGENQNDVKSNQIHKHGPDWLLDQPESHYVVQLMTSTYESAAREFVKNQTQEGEYAIYRKNGRNKIWYVVTFGVYEKRIAAKKATQLFQSETSLAWVRKMSAVQAEIEEMMEQLN